MTGAGARAQLGVGVLDDDVGVLSREDLRVPQLPAPGHCQTKHEQEVSKQSSIHPARWAKQRVETGARTSELEDLALDRRRRRHHRGSRGDGGADKR
jgi:hypothetical protein